MGGATCHGGRIRKRSRNRNSQRQEQELLYSNIPQNSQSYNNAQDFGLKGNVQDISTQLKGMLGLLPGNMAGFDKNNNTGSMTSSYSKTSQQNTNQKPPPIDTSDFPSLNEASNN